VIVRQVCFKQSWRRRIGKGLDPHHVEIASPWRQFGTTAGAKQRHFMAGVIFGHAAILRHAGSTVKNRDNGEKVPGVENIALLCDDGGWARSSGTR
jgi:hypothetical protein